MNVPISFTTAALGGKVKVPLIDEVMECDIPEGTQNGKIFFYRGKGIKTNRGSGDLYVEVSVEVPTKLNKAQKQVVEQLKTEIDVKQCAQMKQYRENMSSMYGIDPY